MSTSALSHALPGCAAPSTIRCSTAKATGCAPASCQPAGALYRFAAEVSQPELPPPAAFVPAASTDCMQIAITDFTAFCVFPTLMHHLQREAPGLRFELLAPSPALTELLAGEVDRPRVQYPDEPAHPDLEEINWLRDEYVVISRQPDGATGRLPCGPSSGGDPVE